MIYTHFSPVRNCADMATFGEILLTIELKSLCILCACTFMCWHAVTPLYCSTTCLVGLKIKVLLAFFPLKSLIILLSN